MKTLTYLGAAFSLVLSALGQAPAVSSEAIRSGTAYRKGINKTRILDEFEVRRGVDSTVFRRVSPPVELAVPPAAPAQIAAPLTAAEAAVEEARAAKKSELLFVSATVFDRRVTELRWSFGGRQIRAWSNVDFNTFTGVVDVETADTVYGVFLAVGNESTAELVEGKEGRKDIPAAKQFTKPVAYFVADGTTPPVEALAGLDALHLYFQDHRKRLVAAAAQRDLERVARERAGPERPAVPRRTVIEFWPKKSRNYSTGK